MHCRVVQYPNGNQSRAFSGFPERGRGQLDFIPADPAAFKSAPREPHGTCYNAIWLVADMTQTEYLLDVLGGAKVFRGPKRSDPAELRTRIKSGLPYQALESVRRRLRLTLPEAATILHTPMRTLARRKRERKLQAVESDRLVRLARVAAHAVAVFGNEPKAAAWLRRRNRALGNELPFLLLDTEVGTAQVEDVLGRIEHGIVA